MAGYNIDPFGKLAETQRWVANDKMQRQQMAKQNALRDIQQQSAQLGVNQQRRDVDFQNALRDNPEQAKTAFKYRYDKAYPGTNAAGSKYSIRDVATPEGSEYTYFPTKPGGEVVPTGMYKPKSSKELTADQQGSLSSALSEGRLSPYKINSRTATIWADLEKNNPGTNWNQIQANTGVEVNEGINRQKINLAAVIKPIEELKKAASNLGWTQFPALNKFIAFSKKQTGNTKIVEFEAIRNNVMMELANAMRGSGISEASIELEMSNWSTAYTTEQLVAAAEETIGVVQAKQESLYQRPYPGAGNQVPAPDVTKINRSRNTSHLPEGITEEDIAVTMKNNNMSREQVLAKLGGN